MPVGIHRLYQFYLFLTQPFFYLFFAINRVEHIVKTLPVHSATNVEVTGVTLERPVLMFPHTDVEITAHAGIKSSGRVGDDVKAI